MYLTLALISFVFFYYKQKFLNLKILSFHVNVVIKYMKFLFFCFLFSFCSVTGLKVSLLYYW